MTTQSFLLLLSFLVVLLALAWPVGSLLARVADGRKVPGLGWLSAIEKRLYRAAGVPLEAERQGMAWKAYALALLVFNALGVLFVYAVQRLQSWLPLNPQGLDGVGVDSSFNTAISFVSNTNWQGYVGEQTMSYLSQMLALTGQNFFSAATGIAVAFALFRIALGQIDRQLLGRPDTHHAVRVAAAIVRVRHLACRTGRYPEFLCLSRSQLGRTGRLFSAQDRCLRTTAEGCCWPASHGRQDQHHAVDRHGPGRFTGSD